MGDIGLSDIAAEIRNLATGQQELATGQQELKAKFEASEAKAEKARISRFIIQPGPPSKSSPSRASLRELAEDKRNDIKAEVLDYYGLLVNCEGSDKKLWTAHTMLDTPDSPPLPLKACTLAHIWPKEQAMLASELAAELELPDGFYTQPRNYLILPRDAHEGFDNEALMFVPSANGSIKVRKWRVEDRSDDEAASLAKYFGRELTWPNKQTASPSLPFMRLLAFRMMSAGKSRPVGEPDGISLTEQEAALNSSVTSAGNEAVRDLCGRLSLL